MTSKYQIADEPAPSALARYAVNPLYPMLAGMLAGVWLAWPWFAFNSFAVGSPTRRTELAWLIGGLIVPPVVGQLLLLGVAGDLWPPTAGRYIGLSVVVMKLVVIYAVFTLQSRTIEIYEYYGGKLVTGVWLLILGFYVGDRWLADLPILLQMMLS